MTSLLDFSSSPDPLGDEVPSSVMPSARRNAGNLKSIARESSVQYSGSSNRTKSISKPISTRKSPRKQTFELDVGNGRSPQRLLVTVEAEHERGQRGAVSRRLFNASPTRSVSRRREGTTTTTTVPLRGLTDDEADETGNISTVRRRGRPRVSLGSKNGTPAPRGKKRAGTPLTKTSSAKRHSGEAPSETDLENTALLESSQNAAVEPTPKPKTRTKKTPKKAGTPAVPSSNPTGRKRGRPRKALMPEEVADLNSEADRRPDNMSILPSDNVPMTEEIHMDGAFDGDEDRRMSDFATSQIGDVRQSSATGEDTTRLRTGQRGVRFSSPIARYSEAFDEVSSHQGRADESDAPMFDDYTGEVHSDVESETEGVDGATYSGPDNLTHASEFSMINVEELPSFQASLQSNRSGIIDQHQPFPEAGDETNMIINQTLESLRRSTQTEADGHSHIEDAQNRRESIQTTAEHESADHTRNSRSAFGSSQSSWMQSPRRPPRKSMPLSRQVFSNKAPHVDDSFSELPDSILRAATPGRLPMKPVTTHVTDEYSNMDEYEDEFSQIPDEVLEAATPRPPRMERRVDHNAVENVPSLEEEEEEEEEAQSNSRSTNIGSDRLPTPDDTNSSTTDAKNIHGEEAHKMPVDSSAVANTSELNIRSSPPTISRQMNTMTIQPESGQTITRHFDTMALVSDASRQTDQEDHAGTQRNKGSSPAAPLQNSGSPGQTRKSPSPVRRPTLSPIVRAGRTLQNIMSDRSSPDEHGSSLASPFRGPGQNDSRQSSIARSPVRNGSHRGTGSDGQTPFNPLVSVTQNIRSAFGSMRQTAPVPAPVPAPTEAPSVREENGSFAADMAENLRIEAPGRSARSNEIDQAYDLPQHENLSRGLSSSLRAAAVGRQGDENELTSALDENEISSPANQRSRRLANSSAVGTLSSLQNQVQEDGDEEEEQQEMYEEDFDDLFNLEEDGNVEDQEPAQDEEIGREQGLESDEVAGIEPEMEPEEEQDEEPADTTAAASDEDDMDLWDIEASRPTPRSTKALRAEAQERRQSQIPPRNPASADTSIQAGEPAAAEPVPPRRNKIPSPWRRNPRRLIYQDDFRSPAELEMEDSPPSEGRPVPTMQPPAVQEQDMEFEGTEEEFSRSREEDAKDEHDMNQYGDQDEDEDEEPDHFQAGQDFADDGSYELMEEEELDEPQSLPRGQGYPQKDAPLVENSVLQEYSMISEPGKPSGPVSMQDSQDKSVSARKSFFGRFDIMSFFSSPRPPPVTNNPPTAQVEETPAAHKMNGGPLPQSIRSEKSVQDEPQSALRATGLFPTIKQKIFNPSPSRTVDLFSPGTDLRSNDTVADTYAESPSTPDRQDFPHIPQKRNFTPLSAQSRNTASLFTPSHQGSTPDRDTHTPSPSYDDLREPEYSDEDEYSGEQESASTDDGPSFEHIPPREKPSHWDKNLSPAKSSMRSPLKPKTPGRVVAFTNSVANSDPPSEDQNDQQEMLTTIINGSAKIATSNPRTAILNPTPLRIPASYRGPEQDKENALSPIKPLRQVNQPLPVTRAQVSPQMKLSPTVWTRGHWVRLDEILQLRQRDPMQFQMVFPSVGLGKHPLSGLEVATHDAQMILEDWHMQVVEAFRSELLADSGVSPDADDDETHGVWDANSLSKRLFALMVGEERRRTGKYVSGQSHLAGISSRKGKEIAR